MKFLREKKIPKPSQSPSMTYAVHRALGTNNQPKALLYISIFQRGFKRK